MELTVDDRRLGDVTLLYPKGFINAHTVRTFEAAIKRALDARQFKIVINCADLVYIASAGLGAMMGVIEEIREEGGDLRLSDLNEVVRNIFDILGFNHVYRIFPSERDALSSFGAGVGQGGA